MYVSVQGHMVLVAELRLLGQLATGADQHLRAIINNDRLQHTNLCC